MIAPEKVRNAFYALQAILTHARFLAAKSDQAKQVVGLLDSAEYLPGLMASQSDETVRFREVLLDVAKRYRCAYIVQCFDDPVPSAWHTTSIAGEP
ncbi:MAG TPA: hypothetical protein VKH81_06845 [Candidatus Angelobacter sp.]|nr:hypothetical protein [Candidatus Angelobacter sp.]